MGWIVPGTVSIGLPDCDEEDVTHGKAGGSGAPARLRTSRGGLATVSSLPTVRQRRYVHAIRG